MSLLLSSSLPSEAILDEGPVRTVGCFRQRSREKEAKRIEKFLCFDVKSRAQTKAQTFERCSSTSPRRHQLRGICLSLLCCIRCGPDEERTLDIVPGGTELGTQVKTVSRAGRTHSQ